MGPVADWKVAVRYVVLWVSWGEVRVSNMEARPERLLFRGFRLPESDSDRVSASGVVYYLLIGRHRSNLALTRLANRQLGFSSLQQ